MSLTECPALGGDSRWLMTLALRYYLVLVLGSHLFSISILLMPHQKAQPCSTQVLDSQEWKQPQSPSLQPEYVELVLVISDVEIPVLSTELQR